MPAKASANSGDCRKASATITTPPKSSLDELQRVVGGRVYSRKIGGEEHQYRHPNIGERGVVAGAASDPLAHLKFDSNSLGKFQRQIDILFVPQDTQR